MIKNYPIEIFHWSGMTDSCIDMLKNIIEESPELINSLTKNNENALIIASRVNNINIVQYLLEETSINPYQISTEGNAFLVAVKNNNTEIALLLANQYNLDVNNKDINGKNAYHYAAFNGNDKIVEFLLNKNILIHTDHNGENPLFDLISDYNKHQNYWCFELLQMNMNHEILFLTNNKNINIIEFIEDLIISSNNKVQKKARIEQFTPLKYILLNRF